MALTNKKKIKIYKTKKKKLEIKEKHKNKIMNSTKQHTANKQMK